MPAPTWSNRQTVQQSVMYLANAKLPNLFHTKSFVMVAYWNWLKTPPDFSGNHSRQPIIDHLQWIMLDTFHWEIPIFLEMGPVAVTRIVGCGGRWLASATISNHTLSAWTEWWSQHTWSCADDTSTVTMVVLTASNTSKCLLKVKWGGITVQEWSPSKSSGQRVRSWFWFSGKGRTSRRNAISWHTNVSKVPRSWLF